MRTPPHPPVGLLPGGSVCTAPPLRKRERSKTGLISSAWCFQRGFRVSFQPVIDAMKPKLAPLNEGGTAELLNKVTLPSLKKRNPYSVLLFVACRTREWGSAAGGGWPRLRAPDGGSSPAAVLFGGAGGPGEGDWTFRKSEQLFLKAVVFYYS